MTYHHLTYDEIDRLFEQGRITRQERLRALRRRRKKLEAQKAKACTIPWRCVVCRLRIAVNMPRFIYAGGLGMAHRRCARPISVDRLERTAKERACPIR